MQRTVCTFAALAALTLGTTLATTPATASGTHVQADKRYTCESFGGDGFSQCTNNGHHAWGFMEGCYYPNDVVIDIQYYGHVTIAFQGTFPPVQWRNFYFDGGPLWAWASWDAFDTERGWRVYWDVHGTTADDGGWWAYDVEAWCDTPD